MPVYASFYGLREAPFSITPDPRFLFMSDCHQEAFAHLMYSIREANGFVVLTGEVGAGKTTLCRAMLAQLPEDVDVALILHSKMDARELVSAICDDLGIEYDKNEPGVKPVISALNSHLLRSNAEGRRTIVLIDEAQNLSVDVLEEVRLLTNLETDSRKLLQIALVGQPELADVLERQDLRQLAQRITARYHLEILDKDDVAQYVGHRLHVAGRDAPLFTAAAVRALYRRTGGVPRLINTVSDRALMGGYAESAALIERRHIERAADEVLGVRRAARAGRPRVWVWVLLLSAVALGGLGAVTRMPGPWLMPWQQAPVLSAEVGAQNQGVDENDPAGEAREVVKEVGSVSTDTGAAAGNSLVIHEVPTSRDDDSVGAAPGPSDPDLETVAANAFHDGPPPEPVAGIETPQPIELPFDVARPDDTLTDPPVSGAETVADTSASEGSATPAVLGHSADVAFMGMGAEDVGAAAASPLAQDEAVRLPPASEYGVDRRDTSSLRVGEAVSGSYEWALRHLFKLWERQFDQLVGMDPCGRARWAGLACVEGVRGRLNRLVQSAHPYIARLSDAEAGDGFVVVLGVNDLEYLVAVPAGVETVERGAFDALWTGDAMQLWSPPGDLRGSGRILRRGDTGRRVSWLQEQLGRVLGVGDLTSGSFDEETEQAVRRFQELRGIKVDGIAGVRTFIQIQQASGQRPGPRLMN
ncbi:MAG: AAA family ATPase [Gammaproteobacteria bacterium]